MDCENEANNIIRLQNRFVKESAAFYKAIGDGEAFAFAKPLHKKTLATMKELKAAFQCELDCLNKALNSFDRKM